MSTHEINAKDLAWAEVTFSDTEEAQASLRWLQEQIDEESDPKRRKQLEDAADEISELLFQEMFDLI